MTHRCKTRRPDLPTPTEKRKIDIRLPGDSRLKIEEPENIVSYYQFCIYLLNKGYKKNSPAHLDGAIPSDHGSLRDIARHQELEDQVKY